MYIKDHKSKAGSGTCTTKEALTPQRLVTWWCGKRQSVPSRCRLNGYNWGGIAP